MSTGDNYLFGSSSDCETEAFEDFNAPAFGIGDIVTSRRNKRVGIVKDYQVNEEKTDYDYFIAWLAEYNEREKMRARELRRY